MPEEKGFKKLVAWKKADDLASALFRVSQGLSPQHRWLSSQIARAAISVPANIAEGYGRGTQGDYLRFLDIARGSLAEVEYYIHFLAKENLIDRDTEEAVTRLHHVAGNVLHGLWRSLKAKLPASWDHTAPVQQIRELRLDTYEVDA